MRRRTFLAAASYAPALFAKRRFEYSRISVLTDEVAKSPSEAFAFAKQYGLRWVELRSVPGARKSYWNLPEEELRSFAAELKEHGLKVSFLNTGLLKFTLPGTEPVRRRNETEEQRKRREAAEAAQFERRLEDVRTACKAARIVGTDKVRIFAFVRTANPRSLYPRIAEIITEMAREAEKENITLLLENEGSCNVATSAESAEILKMLPKSVGLNWDPHNGFAHKEVPFPDGYRLLPKDRLGNVQIKAKSLLPEYNQLIDWKGIFDALAADGYRGKVGLETHIFDGTLIEAAHKCMRELQRILQVS
ncbi:MAG: sugar phosphate isomerase/epimerase [Bryobacteraceae bacterium]|nr:sugar phosphate isomerase/epimerase [Bryobacteraceae bacterium]